MLGVLGGGGGHHGGHHHHGGGWRHGGNMPYFAPPAYGYPYGWGGAYPQGYGYGPRLLVIQDDSPPADCDKLLKNKIITPEAYKACIMNPKGFKLSGLGLLDSLDTTQKVMLGLSAVIVGAVVAKKCGWIK